MLDSVFITVLVIAVILQIITVYEKSLVFAMLSLIFWISLMASALGIEVPYVIGNNNVTGGVNITTGSHVYAEPGMSALCLAFIMVNVILIIVYFMEFRRQDQMP